MKNKLNFVMQCALALLVAFAGTAIAAGTADPSDPNALDLARMVFDAAMGGHYLAAFAFALFLGIIALKKWGHKIPKIGPALSKFTNSDPGGVVMTFAGSFFGAAGTSLLAFKGFAGFTLALLKPAFLIAWAAILGFVGLKKVVMPALQWLTPKLPTWMQMPFAGLLALLDRLFSKPTTVADAEKAGDAAVAKNPPTGATGAAGSDVTEV
jgi:hypothetical protein